MTLWSHVHRYTARCSPAIRAGKGWRGRRELAPRCSATQLGASSARAWTDTPCCESFVPHAPHALCTRTHTGDCVSCCDLSYCAARWQTTDTQHHNTSPPHTQTHHNTRTPHSMTHDTHTHNSTHLHNLTFSTLFLQLHYITRRSEN